MSIEVVSVEETRRSRFTLKGRDLLRGLANTARRPRIKRTLRITGAVVLLALGISAYLLHSSYTYYADMVDARLARGYLTSRAGIYAAPRTLRPGQALTVGSLQAVLRRAGYIESEGGDVWNGSFTVAGEAVRIKPHYPAGQQGPEEVEVNFNTEGRVARISGDGATIASFTLEPEVLSNDQSMKTGARTALGFRDLPPVLVHAILSIEDRRFFEHGGVDVSGIARALFRNVSDDRTVQGGSTITQQLVKNTYLSPERTFQRKYAEAMLALTLEQRLSKEEIFALYCNEIYLGQRGASGVRGVAQAARVYFNKELKDLTLAEAATLAGMIQSPNRYTPDRHPEASADRRRMVLAGMVRDGFISADESTAAGQETLVLAPITGSDAAAPYFVDYVNRLAEQQMAAMERSDERSPRVYTTIDTDLQAMAETALKRQLDQLDAAYPNRTAKPEAALIAMDPRTGNVVAMVGGRNYADSQLNRVTDALRQPGSTFKPFVYAAALETNISPVSMFHDGPQDFVYDNNKHYRPANYGGGYSGRDVMMRSGLVRSLNTVTVNVAMNTGLKRVARMAADFGLPRPEPYPSEALGTTEVTPLSLAAAYTAFANGGVRVEPNVIARINDSEGEEIIHAEPRTRQVIEADTAYMITDMLQAVIEKGTARRARGAVGNTAIAGKTGTSHDSWFVGYTPNLVCAVWVGFDDNTELGLTGAEAALPIWTEFVKNAVDARPELGGRAFAIPAGIDFVQVDPDTARLASVACPQRETIAVTRAYAPNTECGLHFRRPMDPVVERSTIVTTVGVESRPAGGSNAPPPAAEPLIVRAVKSEKSRNGRSLLVSDIVARREGN
jgi:penicillin-binding protein 1B